MEGVHSILNLYRIHSITLKARPQASGHHRKHGVDAAALILEGGLRSLNNVLEKLHQSYFFYYLVSPNSFLSIAYYFPALGLQLLALAVHQYQGWTDGSSMKSSLAVWLQAYISAAMVYFA